jgi:hypothetical protein
MTVQTVTYRLTSSAALMQHNGQLADPLNRWSKLIKAISAKRKKTDADYAEMARLEFSGSLYMDPDGPVIPSFSINAMLVNAAKKFREGDMARTGVFCFSHARLNYDGPRTMDGLWAEERFRDARLVKVQTARVVRTRPIFNEWSADITLDIDTSILNPNRVNEWMDTAGRLIGLLEMRPTLGRFTPKLVA